MENKGLAPVVQKVDNAIHRLNNWGLVETQKPKSYENLPGFLSKWFET